MIVVQDVVKHFGGLAAVDGVSMEIKQGTVTGLIGPNGAGKSTLFNLIAGNLNPESGSIYLDGEDVTGLKPHMLFSKGLLRTCLLYTSPSPRDRSLSRMPSSA